MRWGNAGSSRNVAGRTDAAMILVTIHHPRHPGPQSPGRIPPVLRASIPRPTSPTRFPSLALSPLSYPRSSPFPHPASILSPSSSSSLLAISRHVLRIEGYVALACEVFLPPLPFPGWIGVCNYVSKKYINKTQSFKQGQDRGSINTSHITSTSHPPLKHNGETPGETTHIRPSSRGFPFRSPARGDSTIPPPRLLILPSRPHPSPGSSTIDRGGSVGGGGRIERVFRGIVPVSAPSSPNPPEICKIKKPVDWG